MAEIGGYAATPFEIKGAGVAPCRSGPIDASAHSKPSAERRLAVNEAAVRRGRRRYRTGAASRPHRSVTGLTEPINDTDG